MFECPNPAHIVQTRDFSCKKVQSTDSYFFFQCLKFFPVWRVGVNLSFFSSSQKFFSSVYPKTSKSTGKKNIGMINYDIWLGTYMDAYLWFAGDHETHWCIVFVVPSACWHIGSYWIIILAYFGILFHVIEKSCKIMLLWSFMLCFPSELHDIMTWQCTIPLVGYLLMGVASRRPRGNKPPGRLCIGLISKILEHRGYLHLCTIYVLTMY